MDRGIQLTSFRLRRAEVVAASGRSHVDHSFGHQEEDSFSTTLDSESDCEYETQESRGARVVPPMVHAQPVFDYRETIRRHSISSMSNTVIRQSSELQTAQPAYVFRGHNAQIHSLLFSRDNLRLISGDADGWVVIWDTVTRRAKVVWQAHHGSILGVQSWDEERLITHGRDHEINIWQVKRSEEADFNSILPAEDPNALRKKPWLLHTLPVNALNFCAFAMSSLPMAPKQECREQSEILIATPGTKDMEINIFHLPSERRMHVVSALPFYTGMVMALALVRNGDNLVVVAGYESGHSAVHVYSESRKLWNVLAEDHLHSQPVLSLDLSLLQSCYLTSGADDVVCRHELPRLALEEKTQQSRIPEKIVHTKHSGQQSLAMRSDGRIFATAGWDSRVRVYSTKTLKELAVLKWHKEGCYAVRFAGIRTDDVVHEDGTGNRNDAKALKRIAEQRREKKVQDTHWLAAGSKDGKISLWDIY